ncbi:MAG: formylglycine-generating enzyme family protein [Bacteroidaceae bacterium]|nr:formylglycine-generating enzyme family protein [Bacteroidaceae bacterium]
MVIDGYLTGVTETISASGDPYEVDNSRLVGTWYKSETGSITFNADGTTDYIAGGTYKFRPVQGTVLFYDAVGKPVSRLKIEEITSDYLVVGDGAGNGVVVYYTSAPPSSNTYTVNGVSFKMVPVTGGTFWMGAQKRNSSGYNYDADAYNDEAPLHSVTLSDYFMGETEVTQALWVAVMGNNPSNRQGDNLPVEQVSWDDCQEFITKLNTLTGQTFRLPTEAEWEYAARGGSKSQGYKYSGSNIIEDVAWYTGNSSSKTHDVGTKQPNELGLYDMSGNVWEWCQDWFDDYSSNAQTNPTGASSGSYRVDRGGGWNYAARGCRVSFRDSCTPTYTNYSFGFRLAL